MFCSVQELDSLIPRANRDDIVFEGPLLYVNFSFEYFGIKNEKRGLLCLVLGGRKRTVKD